MYYVRVHVHGLSWVMNSIMASSLITVVMVGFDPTMYTVSEGGVVSFTIRRLTPATRTVSVIFNTIPGSATGVHTIPSSAFSPSLPLLCYAPFLSFPSFILFSTSQITTIFSSALTTYSGLFLWGANFRYFRGLPTSHEKFYPQMFPPT